MDEPSRERHTLSWRNTANAPSSLSCEEMIAIMRLICAALVFLSSIGFSSCVLAQAPPSTKPKREAPPRAGGSGTATSAPEPNGEIKAVTQAILEEIDKRSELMTNIEYQI